VTSLLHIDSSARRASFSRKVAAAFVAEWRAVHPAGGYAYRDLGAHPVPPVDEARTQIAVQASAAGIQELAHMTQAVRTTAQERSWAVARPLIEELLAADAVLIASPMYNLSIPSTLKAWIDQISFPWLPLAGRTAVVVTARGGSYAPGTPREGYDHQEPYLRAYFQTLGLTDLHFIHTELTNARHVPFLAQFQQAHETSRVSALDAAARLARTIGQPVKQPT
jgi:FMN-dependent NADH-azoreductase